MNLDLRALIFDLDGVIADTIYLHYLAWKRLADEEGIPFTLADNRKLLGLPRVVCLPILLQGRAVSDAEAAALLERKNAYFLSFARQMTPADAEPGVAALIAEARAAGLKIALGSSSQNARLVLTRVGLIDQFDAIGDGLTVAQHKPAPDIYLWAAQQISVPPAQAVVFEDSEVGVQAARAAGCRVVGLGQYAEGADVRLDSLEGVTLARLRALLDGSAVSA